MEGLYIATGISSLLHENNCGGCFDKCPDKNIHGLNLLADVGSM